VPVHLIEQARELLKALLRFFALIGLLKISLAQMFPEFDLHDVEIVNFGECGL
jgi:hypothetical protein